MASFTFWIPKMDAGVRPSPGMTMRGINSMLFTVRGHTHSHTVMGKGRGQLPGITRCMAVRTCGLWGVVHARQWSHTAGTCGCAWSMTHWSRRRYSSVKRNTKADKKKQKRTHTHTIHAVNRDVFGEIHLIGLAEKQLDIALKHPRSGDGTLWLQIGHGVPNEIQIERAVGTGLQGNQVRSDVTDGIDQL
jgi:hypothetical protein